MHVRHSARRAAIAAVFVLGSMIGMSAPAQQPDASVSRPLDGAAVDRYVEAYRARTGLPGVIVAITRGGEIVHVAGYGHTSTGAQITAQTPMPIASVSKSVTALAVMQLVEAGRIALDEPVRRYLPEFTMADPRAARITVRQLLAHRSGMADTRFREKSVTPPASLQAGVAMLHDVMLASDPGAAEHYHNPNYWVAARLVELVSGEPFATYLRQHVFESAGMRVSSTVGRLEEAPNVARGYIRLYGRSVARPEPAWYLDGSSGVVTTASDLAEWLILQSEGGTARTGAHLVAPASIAEMHDHDLGWKRGPVPGQVTHTGWLFTYTARQVLVPRTGYGFAVVTNRGISLGPDDADEIMRGLIAIADGGTATVGAPVGLIVDGVLVLLTLGTAALGVRSIRRARRRPALGSKFANAVGLVGWAIPIAFLLGLRRLLVFVFAGRDGRWAQILYMAPSLVGWLAVSAAFGIVVIVLRAQRVLGGQIR